MKPTFPRAKMKKIMQIDDDVGRISKEVQWLMSETLCIFTRDIMASASEVCSKYYEKKVTPSVIRRVIDTEKKFDFLRDKVAEIPPLPETPPPDKPKPTAKR